jgi:membrane-bound lytic murein transglycosylase
VNALKLVEPISKICFKCKQAKELSAFSMHSKTATHRSSYCRSCANEKTRAWRSNNPERSSTTKRKYYEKNKLKISERAKNWAKNNRERLNANKRRYYRDDPLRSRNSTLKMKYGISQQQYNDLLVYQNSNCAICGINQSDLKKPLYVDHCHKRINFVRGLLCQKCNTGIGHLGDSVEIIEKALIYLKRVNS